MASLPKTKQEALAIGSNRYNTGKPCKHGHMCDRATINCTCVECKVIKDAASHLKHRDKRLVKIKAWYEKNKEHALAKAREWAGANPEKVREASRKWAKENREVTLAGQSDRNRKYRSKHLEQEKERLRIYKQTESGKASAIATRHKRRAALNSLPMDKITHQKLAGRDGWICHICKKRVSNKNWSIDHIVPVSLGGSHTWSNVNLAHMKCNASRGAGRKPAQLPLISVPQ